MGGQAIRLACVLEHIAWAWSDWKELPEIISKDTMLRAIVLIEDYFKPMLKKVLAECSQCSNGYSLLAFMRYLLDNKVQKFNVRTLKRKNKFPIFEVGKNEEKFLSHLTKINIIRLVNTGKTGRPSKDYIVNPMLSEVKL